MLTQLQLATVAAIAIVEVANVVRPLDCVCVFTCSLCSFSW